MGEAGYKIVESVVTVPPALEPVDRDAIVDLHLKVDYTVDDALIDLQIKAARHHVEIITGLSLITQTRVVRFDHFPPCDTIYLPDKPIQSVVVTYQDDDDNEQTLTGSEYWFDSASQRIVVKNSWPVTKCRPGAVTVTCVCGFGSSASNVPDTLREAVLVVTGWMYTNRDQPVPNDLVFGLVGTYVHVRDAFY